MDDGAGEDFHASVPFLEAFGEALFPRRRRTIEVIQVGDAAYRVVVTDRPVLYMHEYPCYLSPVAAAATTDAWPGLRIRHALGRIEPVREIHEQARVAPFVDWAAFACFEDYLRAGSLFRRFRTARNRQNHLAREIGEVTIVAHDDVPGVLDLALAWKSAQARRRGWRDVFALDTTRTLYHLLQERGLQQLTTLRIGGRVVAACAWTRWNGRLSWRLTAHDPEFAGYPVATIVFHQLLRESFAAGDKEFDLLLGAEAYKLRHATHLRRLRPVGGPYRAPWSSPERWRTALSGRWAGLKRRDPA